MSRALEQSAWRRGVAAAKSAVMWVTGLFLVVVALGHQIEHPGSLSVFGLVVAALALLPPTRAFVSRYVSLSSSTAVLILLMIGGSGFAFMAIDQERAKIASEQFNAAVNGYQSAADHKRANSLGLASPAELAAHDAKVAGDAAETERKRVQQAEKDRLAAAEAERSKEASCRSDLQCWGDRHGLRAAQKCRPQVERLAKFQYEWTDGWLGTKFPRFRWRNKSKGQLTYFGDSIKFQNGFGAWQFHVYSCDYDPDAELVLKVEAAPGRLPN